MDANPKDMVLQVLEATTGLVELDNRQKLGTLGRIAQSIVHQNFWKQFEKEWNELRTQGRISDDYVESKSCETTFSRMAVSVDTVKVDTESLELIKNIFVNAAMRNSRDGIVNHYIDIAKDLSTGEVQILQACYRNLIDKEYVPKNGLHSFESWCQDLAVSSGLAYSALVEKYADSLIEKKLLKKREHSDLSGFAEGTTCGLTELAVGTMEFAASDFVV